MFEPNFKSLSDYKTPEWFKDAKFGIWSHWSAACVPEFGDWYARHMYIQDHPQYIHHLRTYGHPSKFGWKDVADLWKAEKFNPDELMDLYYSAGARYFFAMGAHHDGFCNFKSSYRKFNALNYGPHKDILAMWKAAAKNYKLPFGVSDHLPTGFTWWMTNKMSDKKGKYKGVPYDGADPKYKDIYYENPAGLFKDGNPDNYPWFQRESQEQQQYWFNVMSEMIDNYDPDLIYMDGAIPFADNSKWNVNPDDPQYKYGLKMLAHYYNKAIERHGKQDVVYFQKRVDGYSEKATTLDVERGMLTGINLEGWQTDTCFGDWFYSNHVLYKDVSHVIEMLINIVSLGGCLLLNILQKPDGTLNEEMMWRVLEIKKWMGINGSAIHGTVPYDHYGEGPTNLSNGGSFAEEQGNWTAEDYRFTQDKQDKNVINAFVLNKETGVRVIKTIDKVKQATVLTETGEEKVPVQELGGQTVVTVPDSLKIPKDYPYVIRLSK